MSTNLTELKEADATASRQSRRGLMKLMLLLLSIALSLAAFLAVDWVRTARMQRHSKSTVSLNPCRVRDAIRQHAFKPNCTTTEYWGTDQYKFITNDLGFRDEKIRQVPLTDARPRILMLGDSFTEGMTSWRNSYAGKIAAQFPQYDFLNGGVSSYSPSNYLNVAQMLLAAGVEFDEVIVFIDLNDVEDEAAFYRDVDASGAVTGVPPEQQCSAAGWYVKLRGWLRAHLALTAQFFRLFDRLQRPLVRHGYYHLPADYFGEPFDREMAAWTYRKVNETAPWPAGYAPLGVEGGIDKAKAKMTLLWQVLEKRNIPISVVVYPYPSQLVHDTPDSRQVRLWRNWCEGKCKHFISLFPAFFAAKEQCPPGEPGCWYESLFVFGDIHFSTGGNALVADAVSKSLAEQPPVKRP